MVKWQKFAHKHLWTNFLFLISWASLHCLWRRLYWIKITPPLDETLCITYVYCWHLVILHIHWFINSMISILLIWHIWIQVSLITVHGLLVSYLHIVPYLLSKLELSFLLAWNGLISILLIITGWFLVVNTVNTCLVQELVVLTAIKNCRCLYLSTTFELVRVILWDKWHLLRVGWEEFLIVFFIDVVSLFKT